MHFSTLIVITQKDFYRLSMLYSRLLDNLPSKECIFVSGEGIDYALDQAGLSSKASYINENTLLKYDDVYTCMSKHLSNILQGDPLPRAAAGWYYQQFLKMIYAYHCEDEYYMCWDGDTIPCKPFSMFQEGTNAPYFDMKHECHEIYFQTISQILPGMKKCIARSFISEHMLFNCELMKQLIEKIESNNNLPGEHFWEKIIYAIPPEKISESAFSEFETYGTFVAFTDPFLYKLREWHSFRLAGLFLNPKTITDRDFEWLSRDFHAISFEKNQCVSEKSQNLFDNPHYQKKLSAKKMLEVIQEEFKEGYIEVFGNDASTSGQDPLK